MTRKTAVSLLTLAALALLSWLSTLTGMVFWQTLLLLMPFCVIAVGLEWTRPAPDYSALNTLTSSPIEDIENSSRRYIWLNGMWEFNLDGEQRRRRLYLPRSLNTIPGLGYYKGRGSFRRVFSVPKGWPLGRILLHFRGVNYRAEILLDGRQIGQHEGGYTPFTIDVTDRIKDDRDRELEVRVSNELSRMTVPSVADWRNEGGILREVFLETVNDIFIRDVYVFAEPDLRGRATVVVSVKIENPELKPGNYAVEILNPMGISVHKHRIEGWTMQTLQHRCILTFVSLWQPGEPGLYTCRVLVDQPGGDELGVKFGLKVVESREGALWINGKREKLRCVDRWVDHEHTGQVESLEDIERDIRLIRDAGFNTVRLCPFPHHPAVLDACDRLGLFVLEDAPVWKAVASDLVDPVYQSAAERQLLEMIQRDRNHVCVIAWGLANDIDSDTREGRWFIERLARVARGIDYRPVYIISGEGTDDLCADSVDMVGVNFKRFSGASTKAMEKTAAEWREAFPDKPFFLTDYTAQGVGETAGKRHSKRFSQEHQARMLLRFASFAENNDLVSGWSIASFADRWSPGAFASPTPFFSEEGIVTRGRKPKKAWVALQQLLLKGEKMKIEVERDFIPTSWFSWLVLIMGVLAGLFFAARSPGLVADLAWMPSRALHAVPDAWKILLFVTVIDALGWAVMVNRFFRSAPQNLIGSIDLPIFSLVSWLLRAEWRLFSWVYLTILVLWMYLVSLLNLVFPEMGFQSLVNRTALICLPDLLFIIPAFVRVPLWLVILVFHFWRSVLAYTTLGTAGMLVYVVAGPITIIIVCAIVLETKFHILKYLRKLV